MVLPLPRYMNRLSGATLQAVGKDTTKAQPAPPAPLQQQQANAPVTPVTRSLGSRLTGIFGLILILGIGVAFSRNRRAISRRVVAWGLGLQLLFAIFEIGRAHV